jgi:hypothetical protein
MERTNPRDEVNELDIIITAYMPDHMPTNFWKAYERLKQLAKQSAWPKELHAQYMRVLNERDNALYKLERLESSNE